MSVASHLSLSIDQYDARIRTYVPGYVQMLELVAETVNVLAGSAPTIVDLGIGTGALSVHCLRARPEANLIGIDSDPEMLQVARARLAGHARLELIERSFLTGTLPSCDAMVACIALHHIRAAPEKAAFYQRCAQALNPGGFLLSADCFPAADPRLAAHQREQWLDHLRLSYEDPEATRLLDSWAAEDTYFPLESELQWLRAAGLETEVMWRAGGFAVLMASR